MAGAVRPGAMKAVGGFLIAPAKGFIWAVGGGAGNPERCAEGAAGLTTGLLCTMPPGMGRIGATGGGANMRSGRRG